MWIQSTLCFTFQGETSVFCGGVDAAVVQFSYMAPSSNSGWRSWVRSSVLSYHTHDVRASVVADNTLVTGGMRGSLKVLRKKYDWSLILSPLLLYTRCSGQCACWQHPCYRRYGGAALWKLWKKKKSTVGVCGKSMVAKQARTLPQLIFHKNARPYISAVYHFVVFLIWNV